MIRLRRLQPDTVRGIRHWAIELAVVVVGVLLALWAAEWAGDRAAERRMAAAEAAMASELNRAVVYLAKRELTNQCADEQRARLLKAVTESGPRWRAYRRHSIWTVAPEPQVGNVDGVVNVPVVTMSDAAWRSALATGALEPMERERFDRYVELYDAISTLEGVYSDEDSAAAALASLATDIEMTPELKHHYVEALFQWSWASLRSQWFDDFASDLQELGIADPDRVDREMAEYLERLRENGELQPCVGTIKNPFGS